MSACAPKFEVVLNPSVYLDVARSSNWHMLITGSCHCENISFKLDWVPDPSEIPARECSCSFCKKYGGVWTACPSGTLRVHIHNPSLVSKYSFETKTAEFHVCSRCGVVPVVTSLISARLYAVVNVRTFNNVESSMLRYSPTTFTDESEPVRLLRRTKNWVSNVSIVQGNI